MDTDKYRFDTLFEFKSHLGFYAKCEYTGKDLVKPFKELDRLLQDKGVRGGDDGYMERVLRPVADIADRVYRGIPGAVMSERVRFLPELLMAQEIKRLPTLVDLGYRVLFDKYDRDKIVIPFPHMYEDEQEKAYKESYHKLLELAHAVRIPLARANDNRPLEQTVALVRHEMGRLAIELGYDYRVDLNRPVHWLVDDIEDMRELYVETYYRRIESVV